MGADTTIYTIGHSTHELAEFIEILKAYRINLLVDVRSIPRSRHTPQFNEDNLQGELPKYNINYLHLSKLGGLRPTTKDSVNQGWRNASFRGYADYMQTNEFAAGIDELIKIAGERSVSCSDAAQVGRHRPTQPDAATRRTVAIMCAEAVPWRCHRSLIGDALLVRKINVIDIFDAKKSQPEKLTSFAKANGTGLTYPAS